MIEAVRLSYRRRPVMEAEDVDTPIVWHGERPTFAADHEDRRLYVCQRFGRMQAWVDGRKVGDFDSIKAAKAAAENSLRIKPQAGSRVYVTTDAPPLADMTQPPAAGVITPKAEPMPIAAPAAPARRRCKCGAPLGRSGKCPALCEPLPTPLPKYTGPTMVGKQIGPSPVRAGPGWIG